MKSAVRSLWRRLPLSDTSRSAIKALAYILRRSSAVPSKTQIVTSTPSDEIKNLIYLANRHMWPTDGVRRTLEAGGTVIARSDFYGESPTLADFDELFEGPCGGAGTSLSRREHLSIV